MDCPCGTGQSHADCCGPIIGGERKAATAEQLMRARYTAYAQGEIDFILETMEPQRRAETDDDGIREWSENSEWLGLAVLATEGGGPEDETGMVEFVAEYVYDGEERRHHERASFSRLEGSWYFVEGEKIQAQPYVRETPKVGRNDPCPCGSGRKYKKCCGI
jgi:SEC-C motif-containing protein